ncbi:MULTISPECIES: flippase [Nostocales]|uniref:Flippase n=3 Tax=Nostocales TaxID=1161 RepID=A0A0C1RL81_9CYAN|nr:flippase [Tolypothrix bouteillei]KAF3888370.1 flippase [Tolypothrix bouteillei VB521301]
MFNKLTTITQKLSPDLRKIITNVSWLLADKFLQMGLGLFVGIWVARYLGPEKFGIYNYAISFVGMFSPIVNMSLNSIVVRDIANNPSRRDEILGTTFVLSLLGGLLTLLLSVTSISLLDADNHLTHWLVGIFAAGTMFQAFDTIDFWFQSQVQSRFVVLSRQSAYVLMCAVRVGLIQIHAPLLAFAWARLVELALSGIGMVIIYRLRGNYLTSWKVNLQQAKDLLRESFPLIISGFAIYTYSKIDQIMLGFLLENQSQLGFYSVAVKLAEIFDFLPMIVASSILPQLSQLKEQGKDYMRKMQLYFDVMLFLWLIVALPVSLLSSFIVTQLYGELYAPAGTILSIYIWGQFSSNFGLARSSFLIVENKLHYSVYISVGGAFLNIVLNIFLIPSYEAYGATIATIISYFAVTIIPNFLIRDLRPIGTLIVRSLNLYRVTSRVFKLFL